MVFRLRCHSHSAKRLSPTFVKAIEVFFVDQPIVAFDEDCVNA